MNPLLKGGLVAAAGLALLKLGNYWWIEHREAKSAQAPTVTSEYQLTDAETQTYVGCIQQVKSYDDQQECKQLLIN